MRRDLDGNWQVHSSEKHLNMVSQLAEQHAAGFGSADWAYMAGVWHDLDKYRRGFKRYILHSAGERPGCAHRRSGGWTRQAHSATNALGAQQEFPQRFVTLK